MVNTLAGLDLGILQDWNPDKNAPGLEENPIPTQDADQTQLFDILGAVKKIVWTSRFVGDLATNVAKVASFEALVSGNQSSTVALISDFESSALTCKVKNVRARWYRPGTIVEITFTVIIGV